MIVLYQFEISPFCDKVRRIMHLKGVPYAVVEVPLSAALGAIRKVSPTRKVPCIEHAGRRIWDSTTIAHYLEKEFPEPRLVPDEPKARALCHLLEDWADESLYFYEVYLRFNLPTNRARFLPLLLAAESTMMRQVARLSVPVALKLILDQQGLGRKALTEITADLRRHVAAIEGQLDGGEWLLGEQISLADVSVYAQFACIAQTPEGRGVIDAAPDVARWLTRVEVASNGNTVERRSAS